MILVVTELSAQKPVFYRLAELSRPTLCRLHVDSRHVQLDTNQPAVGYDHLVLHATCNITFGLAVADRSKGDLNGAVHHSALLELIDSLTNEGVADSRQIFLLGFSQSCALNYRFAFAHPNHLRGVIGICGGMPGDWETSKLYKQTNAAVFHLSGERDEFYPPARTANYAVQLRERASDVEFRSYDAGHEIVQPMRDNVRSWLKQKVLV